MSELAGFFRFTQFSFTHMQWNECIQRRAVHTVDIAEKKNKADIDGICFLILFTKNKFRTALGNEWESPPPKKEKENLSYLSKTMSNHIQELQQHGSVVKRSECCAVTCCYPLKTFCVI